MSNDPELTAIATTSLSILATAAAAFGPAGVPLYILTVSLGTLIQYANDGSRPPDSLPLEDKIRQALIQELDKAEVKNALAKIHPACDSYLRWARRIAGPGDLGVADVQRLTADTGQVVGPNSSLREGLLMLYNRDAAPNDFSRVQFAVPQYMLGASVLLRFQMIDIGLTHLGPGGVELVPQDKVPALAKPDLEDLRDDAEAFDSDLDKITRYVGGFVVQKILYDEMHAPGSKLAIGVPGSQEARVARETELKFIYLGGADAPLRHRRSLNSIITGSGNALAAIP